jgi:hypothetical protein
VFRCPPHKGSKRGLLFFALCAVARLLCPSDLEQSTVTSGTMKAKQASIDHRQWVPRPYASCDGGLEGACPTGNSIELPELCVGEARRHAGACGVRNRASTTCQTYGRDELTCALPLTPVFWPCLRVPASTRRFCTTRLCQAADESLGIIFQTDGAQRRVRVWCV